MIMPPKTIADEVLEMRTKILDEYVPIGAIKSFVRNVLSHHTNAYIVITHDTADETGEHFNIKLPKGFELELAYRHISTVLSEEGLVCRSYYSSANMYKYPYSYQHWQAIQYSNNPASEGNYAPRCPYPHHTGPYFDNIQMSKYLIIEVSLLQYYNPIKTSEPVEGVDADEECDE